MDKRLFTLLINSLKRQNDVDKELARKLTDAYDVDIFPPDNRILIDAITEVLRVAFPKNIETITFYCWEDNFGSISGYSVEDLWDVITATLTGTGTTTTITTIPSFKNNWDDEYNDAKYSNKEVSDLHKVISHTYEQIEKERNIKSIEEKVERFKKQQVDEAIKNIQVQEFTVISPIRKFRDNK